LISGIFMKLDTYFGSETSLDGFEGLGYDKTNHARWYDAGTVMTARFNSDGNRRI